MTSFSREKLRQASQKEGGREIQCDPSWYIHKPDVQNKCEESTHTHDSMRACVGLDDRVCSGWFAVEQGLRQGLLPPILFNIFFVTVINVASARFKVGKSIMDALIHLRKKRGAGGSNCWRVIPGDAALRHALR